MSRNLDQKPSREPAPDESQKQGSGQGSDSALSAMLKKRREGENAVSEEDRERAERDPISKS